MMTVRCYIAPSTIEGVGLYAAEPIAAGAVVWRFDERFDRRFPRAALDAASDVMREFLERYCYPFTRDPSYLTLDADESRYMNHADAPNLDFSQDDVGIALRAIAAGDELTCDYRCFVEGPLEFLPSRGSAHTARD